VAEQVGAGIQQPGLVGVPGQPDPTGAGAELGVARCPGQRGTLEQREIRGGVADREGTGTSP
jgi:hypothetical protein